MIGKFRYPALQSFKILSICLMVPAIFFLHSNSLKLWFDETVQLSTSHGSHPETLQAFRYAVDPASVMKWNQRYNMDPGGYSLFINLLSPIVKNRFHLYRIINITAFVFGLALLLRHLCGYRRWSPAFIDLLLLSSAYLLVATALMQLPYDSRSWLLSRKWLPFINLLKSGFSIRAYGFEFLFVSALLCTADWQSTYNPVKYVLVALIVFFGLTLRYDFALFVCAYLAVLAIETHRRGELRISLLFPYTWVVLGATLAGLLFVYLFSYRHQMGGYWAPMKLNYLAQAYLHKAKNIRAVMSDGRNILALAIFIFSLWRVFRSANSRVELLYVILFTIYLVISLKGYYPFSIAVDRCLAIVLTFNALLIHYLLALVGIPAIAGWSKSIAGWKAFGWRWLALTLACFVFSIWVMSKPFQRKGHQAFMEAMMNKNDILFDSVMSDRRGANVLIDRFLTPNIKTYYEYRKVPIPQNNYYCSLAGPHGRQTIPDRPPLEKRCEYALGRTFDYYFVPELFVACEGLKTLLLSESFEELGDEKVFFRKK